MYQILDVKTEMLDSLHAISEVTAKKQKQTSIELDDDMARLPLTQNYPTINNIWNFFVPLENKAQSDLPQPWP